MDSAADSKANLPTTSLALGLIGLLSSPWLVGGLLGVFGVSTGLAAQRLGTPRRGRARLGVGLSVAAVAVAAGVLVSGLGPIGGFLGGAGGPSGLLAEWEQVAAPDLVLTTLDGEEIRLSEQRGKRVILNFWATWCGPCRAEMPDLVRLATEHGPEEVLVIGVSDEPESVLRPYLERNGVTFPVVSMAARELPPPYSEVRYIPTNFVLDRNGVIQYIRGYSRYRQMKRWLTEGDVPGEPRPAPAGGA